MGIVRTLAVHESGNMRLEVRDDGSYWVQLGAAGILVRDLEELRDLRELIGEAFAEEDERIYKEYFR